MPQPTSYTRATDFSDEESAAVAGRGTLRTAALDAEFDAVQLNLAGLNANIALLQRDDGRVRDGAVELHALAGDVRALLAAGQGVPRGPWLTATAYTLRDIVAQDGNSYICAVPHTSTVFAGDLAANRWLTLSLGGSPAADSVTVSPAGGITATNVQAALQELHSLLPDGSVQASDVAFAGAGAGAVATNAQERLRRTIQADDYATLEQALAAAEAVVGGADVLLRSGKTYTLTAGLLVPANCGLVGDGTPKLFAPASVFTNTSLLTKYTATSAVVRVVGGLTSPFTPADGVRLRGFKIECEAGDGRVVDAIAARNVTNFEASCIEASGFPVGCGVRASTVRGRSLIAFNHIHSFTTAAAWPTQPQITGIELDGDRVNNTGSQGVWIVGNRIRDLTVTGAALSAYGFQTDGINLQGTRPAPTSLCHVSFNTITNCGEGIDCFGLRNTFVGNIIRDSYDYGYKFIHGASFNDVVGGSVTETGRAGIVLAGSSISGVGDTDRNTFTGVLIETVNPADRPIGNPACFAIEDNVGTTGKVRNTSVNGGSWSMGANGEYGLCDTSTGNNNIFSDVRVITGDSAVATVRVDNGASVVQLAGSHGYRTADSPPTVASAGSIAPVGDRTIVSGTAAISTIDVQLRWRQGATIELIPTGAWTLTTAGNIAIASTAVVGRVMHLTWVAATGKWHPSY